MYWMHKLFISCEYLVEIASETIFVTTNIYGSQQEIGYFLSKIYPYINLEKFSGTTQYQRSGKNITTNGKYFSTQGSSHKLSPKSFHKLFMSCEYLVENLNKFDTNIYDSYPDLNYFLSKIYSQIPLKERCIYDRIKGGTQIFEYFDQESKKIKKKEEKRKEKCRRETRKKHRRIKNIRMKGIDRKREKEKIRVGKRRKKRRKKRMEIELETEIEIELKIQMEMELEMEIEMKIEAEIEMKMEAEIELEMEIEMEIDMIEMEIEMEI